MILPSPNLWKTRFCLNYKKLEYRTEWVENPDIQSHCKQVGIPPTSQKADGSAQYTLPAIHDLSTGAYVADSFVIAEYLDKTYPDTPKIFPHGTTALQAPFEGALRAHVRVLWGFTILPTCVGKLKPASSESYRKFWEDKFGSRVEELVFRGAKRVEEWGNFKAGMTKVSAWYASNGGKGSFMLGEEPSWADFAVDAMMMMLIAALGEDSDEWKEVEILDGGRWKTLRDSLKQYEEIK